VLALLREHCDCSISSRLLRTRTCHPACGIWLANGFQELRCGPEPGKGQGALLDSKRIKIQEKIAMSLKKNVKGVLSQRVRMGFFTVPLWVVGAVFLTRWVRDRRRYA
jgi:hypothetical protein